MNHRAMWSATCVTFPCPETPLMAALGMQTHSRGRGRRWRWWRRIEEERHGPKLWRSVFKIKRDANYRSRDTGGVGGRWGLQKVG